MDSQQETKHLSYDVNLIHPDNYVFLGGSDDTFLLTQAFVHDNFHGTVRRVWFRDVHGNEIPRGNGIEKQISMGIGMGMGMISVGVGMLEMKKFPLISNLS